MKILKILRFVFNLSFIIWWLLPVMWLFIFLMEGPENANEFGKEVINQLLYE